MMNKEEMEKQDQVLLSDSFDVEKLENFLKQFQDFIQSVRIGQFNIDEIARDHPSRLSRYNLSVENRRFKLADLKLKKKVVYYKLYKKYRQEAIEKGLKITEEAIKSLIYTDEEYIKVCKEVIEAEFKLGILQACKEALVDQGRMLFLLCENPENKL